MTIRRMQGNDTGALYRLLSDPAVMRYWNRLTTGRGKFKKTQFFAKESKVN